MRKNTKFFIGMVISTLAIIGGSLSFDILGFNCTGLAFLSLGVVFMLTCFIFYGV